MRIQGLEIVPYPNPQKKKEKKTVTQISKFKAVSC
jgi:hypothetical protein